MVIFMFFKLVNKLFNNKQIHFILVVYIVNCDIALGQIECRLPVDRGVGNITLN